MRAELTAWKAFPREVAIRLTISTKVSSFLVCEIRAPACNATDFEFLGFEAADGDIDFRGIVQTMIVTEGVEGRTSHHRLITLMCKPAVAFREHSSCQR